MIRWYAGSELDAPEAVECREHGYPHCDAEGRTQYENSHFDSEAEAWERLIAEWRGGVRLAVGSVEYARTELAKQESRLVEYACHRDRVERAFDEWKARSEVVDG